MFTKGIYSTSLTSEAADRLFSNITATAATDAPDQSFLATLRALLHKRLAQDETMQFTCKAVHRSGSDISYASALDSMTWFTPDAVRYPVSGEHGIHIVYTPDTGAGEKMLEVVKANAGTGRRYMSNYTRRDDLHVFYARKVKALFYTDADERNTVIFAGRLELKHFHALQMLIPKYLPLLFREYPLNDTETALLKSTGGKSSVEYETLLGEFAKDLDIRSEIIRIKLAGFETTYERMRLDEIRNEIERHQQDYNIRLIILREISQKIQDCQYTLSGLECAIDNQSGDSELVEYFMCNKNLTIISVSGTALNFVAHGYADIYDEEAFEQYADKRNGYLYNNLSSKVTKEQMEKLYRAIFGEGKYKLRICAAYTADMRTGLRAIPHYTFPQESRTYLPNPHIQNHGCVGTYAGRFQEYMRRKDYVGAIDQAVVSARNLNFFDSAAIGGLARDISHTSIKCIEKSDGTLLTPLEAIKELEGGAE